MGRLPEPSWLVRLLLPHHLAAKLLNIIFWDPTFPRPRKSDRAQATHVDPPPDRIGADTQASRYLSYPQEHAQHLPQETLGIMGQAQAYVLYEVLDETFGVLYESSDAGGSVQEDGLRRKVQPVATTRLVLDELAKRV
jgi:hypothetical protein